MNDSKLLEYFTDNYLRKRQITVNRKNKEIIKAKDLYHQGMSMRAIGRAMGIDRRTVKKYISYGKILTIEDTQKERTVLCSPLYELISKRLAENNTLKKIYIEIQKIGYLGTYSNLRMYISYIKRVES